VSFTVESNASLAAEVDPDARELTLAGVTGTGSPAHPYVLPANPWEFLLAAGRATAAIYSPLKELFDVSSHWAIARWFWALDWSRTEVALSPAAAQIRNHHRTAFSEALGLAAGLLVTEHIAGDALPPGIWRGGPMLVDVDSLVSSGTRPDLLILFGDTTLDTYVLEAKGNSSGRGVSIEQLRRGIDQVRAVTGNAKRLVVGVATPGVNVDVHAISVPSPPQRAANRLIAAAEEQALEMERRRLASFAGLTGPEWDGPSLPISELGLEVMGRRLVLPGEKLGVAITVGVDREIIRRLGEIGSISELAEMRSRVSGDGHRRTPSQDAPYSLAEMGRAAAVALDGCAISISLL
jgi:hypothetical protein